MKILYNTGNHILPPSVKINWGEKKEKKNRIYTSKSNNENDVNGKKFETE